jgi:hypothetical protein
MRRQPEYWDEPPEGSGLGQRLARFMALVGVVSAITIVIVVTRRLSQDSLALLIGLSCGVMAMLPTIVLGFMVWRREEGRRRAEAEQREAMQRQPGYGAPPVIVISPQGLPGYGYPSQHALPPDSSWVPARGQREFTIVGGEE